MDDRRHPICCRRMCPNSGGFVNLLHHRIYNFEATVSGAGRPLRRGKTFSKRCANRGCVGSCRIRQDRVHCVWIGQANRRHSHYAVHLNGYHISRIVLLATSSRARGWERMVAGLTLSFEPIYTRSLSLSTNWTSSSGYHTIYHGP